jgi:hypothetical protein
LFSNKKETQWSGDGFSVHFLIRKEKRREERKKRKGKKYSGVETVFWALFNSKMKGTSWEHPTRARSRVGRSVPTEVGFL